MNNEELIKRLKSCVFTVISPELAGSAATAIQLLTERLAEYEDTGLTPQEINQMKARMPLHQWAGENPEKMSIFGVPVAKVIELTDAEKQGKLLALPCKIGDTIYQIKYKCTCTVGHTYLHSTCHSPIACTDCSAVKIERWIRETTFSVDMLERIGKDFFVTREEAEEALKNI